MRILKAALDETVRLVQVLATTAPRDRPRTAVVWLLLAIKLALRPGASWSFRVRWQGPGGPLTASVSDVSELRVLREIFALGEYETDVVQDPRVIVDLGSNIGLSVLYLASRYPDARIVAVEADPTTFARLESNVGHLPQVTAVHAAVSDRDGTMTLHSGARSWASSLVASNDRTNAHEVPAKTLDSLLQEIDVDQVDLLKMDIEGAEAQVLRSPALSRVDVTLFEFHRQLTDTTLWDLVEPLKFEIVRVAGDTEAQPMITLRRTSSTLDRARPSERVEI
jgi:FkbM family methyltransferase